MKKINYKTEENQCQKSRLGKFKKITVENVISKI